MKDTNQLNNNMSEDVFIDMLEDDEEMMKNRLIAKHATVVAKLAAALQSNAKQSNANTAKSI